MKTDISREMQLDELKKLQSEMKESALGLQRDISGELQSAQQAVDTATQFIVQEVAAPPSDAMEVGTPRAVEPVERVERIEPVAADLAASPAVKA
ncbi:MAG: hypothetical protein HY269_07760 [Deltaproteobacteria bacterium]|nr:hypothetical protein [Deltaproteobacteria bacterium]